MSGAKTFSSRLFSFLGGLLLLALALGMGYLAYTDDKHSFMMGFGAVIAFLISVAAFESAGT